MLRPFSMRWFIPLAVLTFALVLAACETDDDAADDVTDTDDTEVVTDDADTDDAVTDDPDDAATDDEDDAAAEEDDAVVDDEEDDATAEEDDAEATDDADTDTDVALGESDWDDTIVFADNDWESALALNRVAQFILEEGYGYETDAIFGTTIPLFQGQLNDEIQVNMEIWPAQMEGWDEAVEDGTLHDLGNSFDESVQGWFVPTYMIEGDEERGIEPVAPDLAHVDDLADHYELFEDPEDPDRGRFYAGISGWEAERVNEVKFDVYDLEEYFTFFLAGSDAAVQTSLLTAYEDGEPWFGYYWGPTWIFGQMELTMLEEPEYTDECWAEIQEAVGGGEMPEEACAYPPERVSIGVTDGFYQGAPDAVEMLENFDLTMEDVSEILLYMFDEDVDADEGAMWFLNERSDLWHDWVPDEVIDDIEAALN